MIDMPRSRIEEYKKQLRLYKPRYWFQFYGRYWLPACLLLAALAVVSGRVWAVLAALALSVGSLAVTVVLFRRRSRRDFHNLADILRLYGNEMERWDRDGNQENMVRVFQDSLRFLTILDRRFGISLWEELAELLQEGEDGESN